MSWSAVRGFTAFVVVVGAISISWQQIEARPIQTADRIAPTTTTTTTTASPVTTTTDPAIAVSATCERTATFMAEASIVPSGSNPGPLARLALAYWSDLVEIAVADSVIEIEAVAAYYQSYLDTAEPFNFDTIKIIIEGDKEKFQQLVTRPAPGLEASRNMVEFLCGAVVPDQPSISARSFDDLEDRLLDPKD